MDLQDQAACDEHTLTHYHIAALSAWDSMQELGKSIESYTMVKQGRREPFYDLLQRIIKAVQIGVTDSEARLVFIESRAFVNANLKYTKICGSDEHQWMNVSYIQWMLRHLTTILLLGWEKQFPWYEKTIKCQMI